MLIDGLDVEIVGLDGSPLGASSSIRPRTISAAPERWPRSSLCPRRRSRCLETITVRPRQDSNLRHRLRRPIRFVQAVQWVDSWIP